jgi:ubiquinone/menaquinone biosynthesis C-methylase UbiE
MQDTLHQHNEQLAAQAFSRQSPVFDALYSPNEIIQYKRKRVREHISSFLPAKSNILELNAGTGEDAIYFARHGHTVHATDIAEGMQQLLRSKVVQENVMEQISTELCSFTALNKLHERGPYDLIFSNFAGLNCTGELDKVLASFAPLVKKDGYVTLVIMPSFCLWETLMALKGDFKTAFRRFNNKKGVKARVEGTYFKCWYYSPSYIIKHLSKDFEHVHTQGLCTIVPPSYLETFPHKLPRLYKWLTMLEARFAASFPWKHVGDYFIITMKRI